MRYALISDIHGNLPALEAVLGDIARRQPDAICHLGDLVGYAPWPNEVVSRLSERGIPGVAGNYDIRPLGGHVSGPTLTLVHGNQALNTVYVTEDRTDDFLSKMGSSVGARPGDVVAFGHTHKPWHRSVDAVHFVNTGSVGRPKDGDWRAGYVMLTVTANDVDVEIVRVEYDVDQAAKAIIDSTLPDELAPYLRSGGGSLVAAHLL